jgi:hypothetical protein
MKEWLLKPKQVHDSAEDQQAGMAHHGGFVAMGSTVYSRNHEWDMRTGPPPCLLDRTDEGLSPGSQGCRTTGAHRWSRFFDGRVWPFLEHSITMGRLTTSDLKDAARHLRDVVQCRGAGI